jgi:hypothetical protein
MDRIMVTVLLLVAVGCCTANRWSLANPPQKKRSTPSAVQVDMRNVMSLGQNIETHYFR